MRRLFGFIAIVLIPTTTLFAQRPNGGSSNSSSGNNSSSSSSNSTYSPPSYSPPASSASSRGSDSGSRSSSSSSSSSGGGSYTPASRSNSEPSSRSSSSSTPAPSYHPNSTNNSSGSSNSNVRDLHNSPQVQNRHEFPSNGSPSKEPASTRFHGTEQPSSRESILPSNNRADVNSGHNRLSLASGPSVNYDPQLMRKYAPQENKLLEKQSRLDAESNKLYTKYKLAGKDTEYERKQAKLEEKRNKLHDKELKLAQQYQLESDRKFRPCKGKDCPAPCPPATVPGPRGGCVATPPVTQYPPQCGAGYYQDGGRCVQNYQCQAGYRWDGRACVNEAFNSNSNSLGKCDEYYARLLQQKNILDDLKRSQLAACTGNSSSTECVDYTQQVSAAEIVYRQLQSEYTQCLTHP